MPERKNDSAGWSVLLGIAYARRGMSVPSAAKLFELPPGEVLGNLEALHAEGLVDCEDENWQLVGAFAALRPRLVSAADSVAAAKARGANLPDVVVGLARCVRGDTLGGARLLLEQVRRNAFGAATAAALCLEILLCVMERAKLEGTDEEFRRRFIRLVVEISNTGAYFLAKAHEVCPLLAKTTAAASERGDRRSVAILNIIKAHMLTFSSFNLSPEADRLFQKGFELGKSFGDEDMLEYVTTFLGFRHFVQGKFPETVRYLASVRHGFPPPHSLFWWELFLSMSLAFVGLDRQAVGILDSCWRTSKLQGDLLSAAILRLHLALLLLMSGKIKAAMEHLRVLRDAIGGDSIPFLNMRLSWILMFYHFLTGNLAASHAMLERCAQVVAERGMPHPTSHFPWMMRALYAFRKAGLPEVPLFRFDSELESSLNSPSLQVQASAWQVKGNMLLAEDGGAVRSRSAFKRALKLFLVIGNPVEAARVKLDLARADMLAGRRNAAERLREGAYAVHQAYGQPEWPGDLPRPRTVRSHFSCLRAPFGRIERGEDVTPQIKSQEDAYDRVIISLCHNLRAERGALFSVTEGDVKPLARFNLTRLEYESPGFARCRNWLRRERMMTQISRRSSPQGQAVCIPVSRGGERFLLYVSNTYFAKELDALSNSALRAMADSVCESLQLAEQWAQRGSAPVTGGSGDLVIMPQSDPGALLTRDRSMLQLLRKLEQIAATDATVLIFGETGVGKELLAKQLHKTSGRKGPFVSVHPASMTETLFESAFFGHEKGAFTGATSQKIGFFELANHGTLFIDEVGEMPLSMQTKFLRVLQERSFIRVGGLREIHSDFRLVTATNRDLEKEVATGNFRQDLYYRLSVVPMHVPPLRQRGNDPMLLAQHFLSSFMRKYQRRNLSLTRADLIKISAYPWPGNVRELENVIERAVILAGEGPLELSLTPPPSAGGEAAEQSNAEECTSAAIIADWPTLAELERRYIKLVLEQTGGRIYGENGAESVLGIGRSTLYNKIRRYGFKARRHYE